jgi:hypothetical protein
MDAQEGTQKGTTAVIEPEISEKDEIILNQITQICDMFFNNRLIEVAHLLGKLSNPGVKLAKEKFKVSLGAERIDRLRAFHFGEYPEFLATRPRAFPLRKFLALKKSTKALIFNPENQVIVWSKAGEKTLRVKELSEDEMNTIFDPKYENFVPPDIQCKRILSKLTPVPVEKFDPSIPVIDEFRVMLIPGTEWLNITIDGKQFRIENGKFKRAARHFILKK